MAMALTILIPIDQPMKVVIIYDIDFSVDESNEKLIDPNCAKVLSAYYPIDKTP